MDWLVAEQLAEIEEVIKQEAERGGSVTWWYCENMTAYERSKLAERLREFGYVTHAGEATIYINWRNAKEN